MECVLELPWPPSMNHYKRVGRVVTTDSGKIYQTRHNTNATTRFYYEVWVKIRSLNATKTKWAAQGSTISLAVTIDLHPPDKRRRDIDNSIKVIFDSLMHGGLIADDSQIGRLFVQRRDIIAGGMAKVTVYELEK